MTSGESARYYYYTRSGDDPFQCQGQSSVLCGGMDMTTGGRFPPAVAQDPNALQWTKQDTADRWCEEGNHNDYTQSDSDSTAWQHDANSGWRFCGMDVEECKAECARMGGCAGVYMTENRCCFPARKRCSGNLCPGGCGENHGHYRAIGQSRQRLVAQKAAKTPPASNWPAPPTCRPS